MEQDHEHVKRQSEEQLKRLEQRRRIEENRAAFYAQRQRELEQAHEATKQATEDKKEKQKNLKQQMMLARQFVKERTA